MFCLLKTGYQWRMLPLYFQKWKRVCYYFKKWSRGGTLEELREVLRKRLRKKRWCEESPSVEIIDSQRIHVTKRRPRKSDCLDVVWEVFNFSKLSFRTVRLKSTFYVFR